jgi:O-antigen/teichoic acid export membrane protein
VITSTAARRLPAISEKLTFFVTTFGAQALRILTSLIMARLVSPKDYGLLALVIAVPGLISDLGDLGIYRALVQIRDEPLEVLEDVGLVLTAGIYCFYLLLAILGGFFLAHQYADHRLILLGCLTGITLYIGAIYNYQLTILNRAMRFRAESFQNIIFAIAQSMTGITLAWAGLGVFALALQPLAAQGVANITMRRHHRLRWPRHFQFRVARKMLSYGGRVTIAQYANNVRDTFINLVVGYRAGPAGLGIFGKAGQVKDLFGHNIITAIDRLLNPTMTAARENLERLQSLFVRGVIILSLICWIGWAGFSANSHHLILVMLGKTWVPVAPILVIMSLDLLTTPFVVSAVLLTHTLGLPMLWLRFTIVSAILLIPSVLIASFYGEGGNPNATMWWIALATILAQNSVGLAFFVWAARRVRVDALYLIHRLLPLAGAAALSFAAMYFLSHHTSLQKLPAIVSLFISSLVGCTIYAAFIWLLDSQTVKEVKQLAFDRKAPEPAPADFCPTCGYDLPASAERCPECGLVLNKAI